MSKIEFIDMSDSKDNNVSYEDYDKYLNKEKFDDNNDAKSLPPVVAKYKWSRYSNMAFINKCKKYREAFETNCVRHEIFNKISEELKNSGMFIDPQKLKWKWDNLKRQYHKKKRYSNSQSTFEYYKDMDEILRPHYRVTKPQLSSNNTTNVNTKTTLRNYADEVKDSVFENENYEHENYIIEDYLENEILLSPQHKKQEVNSFGNNKIQTASSVIHLNSTNWSNQTILSLIRKYKDHRKELTSKQFGKDVVFTKISNELKNENINIDPLRLKCKWSDLKNMYCKQREHPSDHRYNFQFYKEFDEIYGDKLRFTIIKQNPSQAKNYNDTNIKSAAGTGDDSHHTTIMSRHEILSLISKYKAHQNEIESNKLRKDLVYQKISNELKINGVDIDPYRIHVKWQYLKKKYYEQQMGLGAFDFYDELDEIYGTNKLQSMKPETSSMDDYNNINTNISTYFNDDNESQSSFFAGNKNYEDENAIENYLENSNLVSSPLTQEVDSTENYDYDASRPRNKIKWSSELILLLIRKCKKHKNELTSNAVPLNDIFNKISEELKIEGIIIDQDRIRRKWTFLKKSYSKAKTDRSQSDFDYFEEMEDFYKSINHVSHSSSTYHNSRLDKKRLGEKLLECLTELRREKHQRHEELMAVVVDGQNKILDAIKQRDDEFKDLMKNILERV